MIARTSNVFLNIVWRFHELIFFFAQMNVSDKLTSISANIEAEMHKVSNQKPYKSWVILRSLHKKVVTKN